MPMKANVSNSISVSDLIGDIEKASKNLHKCRKRYCKTQYDEYNTQEAKKLEDMKKILTQKNIPADFKKAVDNLNRKSIESKITELLTYCSIEKCEVEIRNLIDSLLKSSTYFCNHDNDEIECEVKKNAEAILKKKNLTPSDYTSFVKLLILRQK